MPPPPPEAAIYLGRVLEGRFRVDNYIAAGGFCHIFEATDTSKGGVVAAKILDLSASPSDAMEFETEGRLLKLLAPATNVVDWHHTGVETINIQVVGNAGSPVLPFAVRFHILELADGSLVDLLAAATRLSFRERLQIFREAVLGAHQMHIRSIVHRDLKAENILLFRKRSGGLTRGIA